MRSMSVSRVSRPAIACEKSGHACVRRCSPRTSRLCPAPPIASAPNSSCAVSEPIDVDATLGEIAGGNGVRSLISAAHTSFISRRLHELSSLVCASIHHTRALEARPLKNVIDVPAHCGAYTASSRRRVSLTRACFAHSANSPVCLRRAECCERRSDSVSPARLADTLHEKRRAKCVCPSAVTARVTALESAGPRTRSPDRDPVSRSPRVVSISTIRRRTRSTTSSNFG